MKKNLDFLCKNRYYLRKNREVFMNRLILTLFLALLLLISCQKGDKEIFTGERG